MTKGYIYIMTNPALKDMVKIGYATVKTPCYEWDAGKKTDGDN